MQVHLTKDALEDMLQLPLHVRGRVDRLLERLEDWPNISGVKPLVGNWRGYYRLRTGDYRVVFRVDQNVVTVWVVRVSNRRDVYEE